MLSHYVTFWQNVWCCQHSFIHGGWSLFYVGRWNVKLQFDIFLFNFDTWHQTISRKRYWMERVFPILDSTIDDALMLSKRFPIFQRTSEAKHHPRQKPWNYVHFFKTVHIFIHLSFINWIRSRLPFRIFSFINLFKIWIIPLTYELMNGIIVNSRTIDSTVCPKKKQQ